MSQNLFIYLSIYCSFDSHHIPSSTGWNLPPDLKKSVTVIHRNLHADISVLLISSSSDIIRTHYFIRPSASGCHARVFTTFNVLSLSFLPFYQNCFLAVLYRSRANIRLHFFLSLKEITFKMNKLVLHGISFSHNSWSLNIVWALSVERAKAQIRKSAHKASLKRPQLGGVSARIWDESHCWNKSRVKSCLETLQTLKWVLWSDETTVELLEVVQNQEARSLFSNTNSRTGYLQNWLTTISDSGGKVTKISWLKAFVLVLSMNLVLVN